MFNKKTVFIVGAGASVELGLPLGDKLKQEIAALVNIQYEFHNRVSGDAHIDSALRQFIQDKPEYNQSGINPFLHVAWEMAKALPLALSIDNYLHAHEGDDRSALVGKLGIARAILQAELGSSIYVPGPTPQDNINFPATSNTWIYEFSQKLCEGIQSAGKSDIFENVSFISFNYDRCIEHYLLHALRTYYRVQKNDDLAEIMKQLKVTRPYGSLGPLEWQGGGNWVTFGGRGMTPPLLDMASNIKTFSEQVEDNDLMEDIRDQLTEAENIVFLGCAYHPQNMKLLEISPAREKKRIFATTIGTSSADKSVILASLRHTFPRESPSGLEHEFIMEDLKSQEFMHDFRRSF